MISNSKQAPAQHFPKKGNAMQKPVFTAIFDSIKKRVFRTRGW